MMAMSRSRVRGVLLAVSVAVVATLGVPVALAATQTPEHVSDAYKALVAGKKSSVVSADLQAASANKFEPSMARGHAQEALAALSNGNRATATMHAQNGAAVEHFTYALRELNKGHLIRKGGASDHLIEALALPHYTVYARAALKAIARGNKAAASKDTINGLNAAVGAT